MLAEEALEVIDPLVQLAHLGHQIEQGLLVGVRGRIARGLELAFGLRELRIELLAAGDRGQDHLDQRPPALDREILGQPADANAVGARDLAVVDLLIAGDDLEERGLARAVGSDQANPIAVPQTDRGGIEDHAIGEEQRDLVEDNQTHDAGGR